MSPPPPLEVSLQKRLGAFSLDATFSMSPGISALFGPSGSGKTTIANLIAGIDQPDGGHISFGNKVFFDAAKNISLPAPKRRVGYVFQDGLLFPHLRVEANLKYGLSKTTADDAFDQIVERLGLAEFLDRYPHELSGGERQRVALGRALLAEPQILLLDEPLSGIDPARREAFLPYLELLPQLLPIPILYISHQIEEILRLADRAVLISDGHVRSEGSLVEVVNDEAFREFTGTYDTGVVLAATVGRSGDGLSDLVVPGGTLKTVEKKLKAGQDVRIRILGRDVAVALERPGKTSVLNILRCEVLDVETSNGEAVVTLALRETPTPVASRLVARITQKSAVELGLVAGQTVYAMVKAVAVTRGYLAS
jgi:molybdate transport system ATP-binding protein